jgi:RHS repeat-associated protein
MPTDYGFTGQRADSATGLDYYGARYYDPTLGQFTSADTVLDGLNRFAYVGGNPISHTDPSGHQITQEVPTGEGQGQYVDVRQGAEGSVGDGSGSGGAGVPPINLWPLIKGIGALLGTLGTDIDEAVTIPTAYAPGASPGPRASGPDELARAQHLPQGVDLLGDLPYYNQGHRPQGAPTTTPGGRTGSSGAPQTQTGGAGAGGTFGGGGGAAPGSPEDDDCGCGDGNLIFYRGTTSFEADEAIERQALNVERIAAHQSSNPVAAPGNVFITSQLWTAEWFADWIDGGGFGLGILRIVVSAEAFQAFVSTHGIQVETPMPDPPLPGMTETRIPFQYANEFDQIARYSLVEPGDRC